MRDKLGIEPGESLFLEVNHVRRMLRFVKVENPFSILAEHAVAEYRAGRTTSLRDFALKNAIALDDE